MSAPVFVHATCVALGERAVLLRGPSGSGKSDLAFRLIRAHAAILVADDQVMLTNEAGKLAATSPASLAGLLELRGLGLLVCPAAARAEIALIVDLVSRDDVPRLPSPRFEHLCGVKLPLLALHAFDLTVPDKVRLALEILPGNGFPGHDGRIGGRT